jgi:DNA-binding NtrC family response regulator
MKKIVAFVTSVPDAESMEGMPLKGPPDMANGASLDESAHTHHGALKLEVVLTDQEAKRIVDALLEPGVAPDSGPTLEGLLQRVLAEAGPDAHDLFDRIVVDVERRLISQVYSECDQVKTHAAARLGINRNTLLKKLRQYQLIEH